MAFRQTRTPTGKRDAAEKPWKDRKLYHKSLKSQENSQIPLPREDPQKTSVIRGLQRRLRMPPNPANQTRRNSPSAADFRPLKDGKRVAPAPRAAPCCTGRCRPESALEHAPQQVHVFGEIHVERPQLFHFLHRMHDRRMIATAELAADFR